MVAVHVLYITTVLYTCYIAFNRQVVEEIFNFFFLGGQTPFLRRTSFIE
jgi:hypothetical protein